MQYRLLRNNIEYGPFSWSELKKQGLQDTDLVWIDGESAAWNFPGDLGLLGDGQNGVSSLPKKKFRITAEGQIVEVKENGMEVPITGQPHPVVSQSVVSDSENKILPKQETVLTPKEVPKPIEITEQQSPSIEPSNTDVNMPSSNHSKSKSGSNTGAFVFAGLLFCIAIAWFGYRWYNEQNNPGNLADAQGAMSDTTTPIANGSVMNGGAMGVADDTIGRAERIQAQQHLRDSLEIIRQQRLADAAATSAPQPSTAPDIMNDPSQDAEDDEEHVHVTPAKPQAANKVKEPVKKAIVSKAPVVVPTPSKTKKNVSDYIAVSLPKLPNGSVSDIHLNVKNISTTPLNSVAINIAYYDASGNYQKGETIHVKNLAGGKSEKVKIPDSKTSSTISYKIANISGEQLFISNR